MANVHDCRSSKQKDYRYFAKHNKIILGAHFRSSWRSAAKLSRVRGWLSPATPSLKFLRALKTVSTVGCSSSLSPATGSASMNVWQLHSIVPNLPPQE